jgi:hypothetical protein
MIVDDPNKVAYDDDISIAIDFEDRTFEKRKKFTEELIAEDKDTFKKFIPILKEFIKKEFIKEPINDLLRIDTDKFLDEDIIEFI